jgi:hypothetical protein
MKLTEPFGFVDPLRKEWFVPAATLVDGASIQQALWSLIGGPYEDKTYRYLSTAQIEMATPLGGRTISL